MADADDHGGEYLLEYQQIGIYVKISALDPRTGTEVSITGPATAGEAVLRGYAVRKREHVRGRRPAAKAATAPRRGIVV
jgi:hypothetical protein